MKASLYRGNGALTLSPPSCFVLRFMLYII